MFQINNYVVYGLTGVCKISDIRKDNYGHSNETEYYILAPVDSDNMTIMVPVDKQNAVMRKICSKEDVLSLLAMMPEIETAVWIEKDTRRTNDYKAALRSGEPVEWIKVIKTLYLEKEARSITGKKFPKIDEDILTTAEKILHQEFALALNISTDEVDSYIKEHISNG